MNIVVTIAAFIVAIGILVTIHELGHYWVARRCDVKILRFSIGFGRPLWLRRVGPDQTEWVIAALPLGGYVRMADERDDSVEPGDRARAFNNKAVWQRILIVSAGPVANFILAAIFYWVLFVAGVPGDKPYLAAPPSNSVAALAGFAERDLIRRVDGRTVQTWSDARLILLEVATSRGIVELEVEDAGGRQQLRRISMESVTPADLDKDFLPKIGLAAYRPKIAPVLDDIVPGSAADRAGLKSGDRIISVGGQAVEKWENFVRAVVGSPGQPLALDIERRGQRQSLMVTPDKVSEGGATFGRIGAKPLLDKAEIDQLRIMVRHGPLEAIPLAFRRVWDMSIFSLKMMGRMLTGDVSWKNLSGPITIADYAGQSAMLGWMSYVNFLALISISLGVLNLLPVPVLDGGQLMYYMAEILKGSPVSDRTMQIGQQVGLTLLLGLTAFAFYNDIHRLLTG